MTAVFFLLVLASSAADAVQPDTLAARMWRQVAALPQEKLYAQTDRTEYTCGDVYGYVPAASVCLPACTRFVPNGAHRYRIVVEGVDRRGRTVHVSREVEDLEYGKETVDGVDYVEGFHRRFTTKYRINQKMADVEESVPKQKKAPADFFSCS